MIGFMRCVHVDGLSAEELRLLGAQGHLIAVALDGEFRASRQPAVEHVYAAGKRAYEETHDIALAIITCNHDNIEDGKGRVTFEVLCDRLNTQIALSVLSLTKPDGPSLNSDNLLFLLVEQIKSRAHDDWRAPFAKAVDSWHNNVTADDFIELARGEGELEEGTRRRLRCFQKTRQFYLPMFEECRVYIPDEHVSAYDTIVAEIDQISRDGLSRSAPASQLHLSLESSGATASA